MASNRPAGARARLLAAADRLFTEDGIRAVGVDRVCEVAGVSKRSLYQHFSGKDELVTAVVAAKAEHFRAAFASPGADPRERILAVFAAQEAAGGYHGCPFVNTVTELKDPDHPASILARAQKVALTDYFADAGREAGANDPELLAEQLSLVFDGANAWRVVRRDTTASTRSTVDSLLGTQGL